MIKIQNFNLAAFDRYRASEMTRLVVRPKVHPRLITWNHHGHCLPAILVNRILATHCNFFDRIRYFHTGETPGEWLFINMRVVKRAGTEYRAVRCHHIPLVSVMLPAFISMAHGYVKTKGIRAGHPNSYRNNVRFPRVCCRTYKECIS